MTRGRTAWVWTPALAEQLTVLWGEGYSAAQIALRLGSITRSGVLGKVNRMGLPRRREPGKKRDPYKYNYVPRPKKPAAQAKAAPRFKVPPSRAPQLLPEPVQFRAGVWEPIPGSTPATLALTTGCKWPVSDPFAPVGSIDLFCNCEAVAGKPYCAEHQARSVGRGTQFERAAVKSAVAISRMEIRRGEQWLEAA